MGKRSVLYTNRIKLTRSRITFFTNLIYTAISYTVANGDVAPFVGHNAILRWSAIQQVSYFDEDGYEKFWSESHVSEDFDMSLRLQVNGYIIRLATYCLR
jgi:cellulose synthase/poly-beta-1,6-N-acetylglucosamine synthase-like glycosyltransferase